MSNVRRRIGDVTVYHFLSCRYALDDLRKRRLKIAQFDDVNDPFELLALELSDKGLRHRYRDFVREMARRYGLLCFSRTWRNPVLWSHYADKHKGICLGFAVPSNCLLDVRYAADRLPTNISTKLTAGALDLDDMKEILRTKFKSWEYEEESRVFLGLEDKDPTSGLYFKDFGDDLRLKQVIIGAMCKVTKATVLALLGAGATGVRVIKARLAFTKFGIVRNKQVA